MKFQTIIHSATEHRMSIKKSMKQENQAEYLSNTRIISRKLQKKITQSPIRM